MAKTLTAAALVSSVNNAAASILTSDEVAGLKAIAEQPDPITHMQVAHALQGA